MPYTSDPTERVTPRILIIAGSDSGGGAGIQADIKTVSALGGHAMTAITAITAQNTVGVHAVHLVPPEIVRAQIDAVVGDIGFDAVKIGMLGSPAIAQVTADWLEQVDAPVVFDPVMIATSGANLADAETIAGFERIMRLASVVTPNLPELRALGGRDAVLSHGCHLIEKGGHGDGYYLTDRLFSPSGEQLRSLEGKRFDTDSTHGTGCTFASALATALGWGYPIGDAFEVAVRFVRLAILEAPGLGAGHGPMGQQYVHEYQDAEEWPGACPL
ncbi:bifunctional hydroxymethylpyrimidine kinase/phosphomethylpyrimidine kinase [Sphingomonas sp.]|uniref:bifunctional hydroxymethylpyrimidine kinase/phosphomethylpyrimidine kinase n=1 Tax=Sphingomonas sp. TaxID=28214 RepID=UPI0035BBAACA